MPSDTPVRIAIHHRPGSFSDRWIEYCKSRGIEHALVNCYDSDIIRQLARFDVLLWHWHHTDTRAILFARQLFQSLQHMPIKVYPDIATCWHFDDKVGQKYLLESIGAPLIPSYVFYEKTKAMEWIGTTSFPKVFKLRCGSASTNVQLVKTATQAARLCRQAFGNGFNARASYLADATHRMRKTRQKGDYFDKLVRLPSTLWKIYQANKGRGAEKGYIYFQDFVPGNTYDTRMILIGNRCYGVRRYCRDGDFRASASGKLEYSPEFIDERMVKISYEVARRIGAQTVAYDFLLDNQGHPCIAEISYCFVVSGLDPAVGYWDENLVWRDDKSPAINAIL